MCQDNYYVDCTDDLGIAWLMNTKVLQCTGVFDTIGECGTYIEIHIPKRKKVLSELKLVKDSSSGFRVEYISTRNLCGGKYEAWFVTRANGLKTMLYSKPFFCRSPSCDDAKIALLNLDE
jgi:hypothetical protein